MPPRPNQTTRSAPAAWRSKVRPLARSSRRVANGPDRVKSPSAQCQRSSRTASSASRDPGLPVVRGQHRDVVAGRAEARDGRLPDALVPARAVRRVAVADGEDPHEGADPTAGGGRRSTG